MKRVLLMLLAVLPITFLASQNCDPDMAYADSTGVFPMPYDAELSPDGGIDKCAVIGENYEFTLTVPVGDTITVPFGGASISLPLDRIEILSVSGLPIGLNYICEPANCVYENSTIGCAKISGIATSDNAVGDYDLVIEAKIFFTVAFPPPLTVTFPDSLLAPGKYTIRVTDDGSEPCDPTSAKEQLKDKVSMGVNPNPATDLINIEINTDVFGDFDLHVVDLLGKTVDRQSVRLNRGYNTFSFDGHQLSNGLYLIVLENNLGTVAQKVAIQH